MGKGEENHRYIIDNKKRKIVEKKRVKGVMKKLAEFCKRTAGQAVLIIRSDNGNIGAFTNLENPKDFTNDFFDQMGGKHVSRITPKNYYSDLYDLSDVNFSAFEKIESKEYEELRSKKYSTLTDDLPETIMQHYTSELKRTDLTQMQRNILINKIRRLENNKAKRPFASHSQEGHNRLQEVTTTRFVKPNPQRARQRLTKRTKTKKDEEINIEANKTNQLIEYNPREFVMPLSQNNSFFGLRPTYNISNHINQKKRVKQWWEDNGGKIQKKKEGDKSIQRKPRNLNFEFVKAVPTTTTTTTTTTTNNNSSKRVELEFSTLHKIGKDFSTHAKNLTSTIRGANKQIESVREISVYQTVLRNMKKEKSSNEIYQMSQRTEMDFDPDKFDSVLRNFANDFLNTTNSYLPTLIGNMNDNQIRNQEYEIVDFNRIMEITDDQNMLTNATIPHIISLV